MMKLKTRVLSLATAMVLACSTTLALAANPKVALETNMGTIVLELYPDKAPKSVENFLSYVNSGFYNGTIFHRVIGALVCFFCMPSVKPPP